MTKQLRSVAEAKEEGRKDDQGKLRYDLIPFEPGIRELAKVYTLGAAKYGDRNWQAGIAYSRLFAALMRHLLAYWEGRENYDPENGQHHLASVMFYCLAFMWFDMQDNSHDDREAI